MHEKVDINIIVSIITTVSIVVAIIILIINSHVTNYINNREKLLSEIKALYSRFNYFRELIYRIFQIQFWKEFSVVTEFNEAVRIKDYKKIDNLWKNNDFLTLYEAFQFISDEYKKDVINNQNNGNKKIFTAKEMELYSIYSNSIFYYIDCRTDTIKSIDQNKLTAIDAFDANKIRKLLSNIDPKFAHEKITIDLIHNVAGEMDETTIDSLVYLTTAYERPLTSNVKKMYFILILLFIFGILVPLLSLWPHMSCENYLLKIAIFVVFGCFISIIMFTGEYIGLFSFKK